MFSVEIRFLYRAIGDFFSYLIAMAEAFSIRLNDSGSEGVLFQFTSGTKDKAFVVCYCGVCCSFLVDNIHKIKTIFS